jgi:hypothetical protein
MDIAMYFSGNFPGLNPVRSFSTARSAVIEAKRIISSDFPHVELHLSDPIIRGFSRAAAAEVLVIRS